MDEKEKDLDAGNSGMPPRGQSPTGSTSTEVDYDKLPIPARRKADNSRHKEEAKRPEVIGHEYGPDEIDHGEPDLDYEDAEDAVPGRELDRQLSRVGAPSSVSQCEL